jgi:hypothetical protein
MRQFRTRSGEASRGHDPSRPDRLTRAESVLRLQRTAGNAATAQLLASSTPVVQRDLDDAAALTAVGTLPAHVLSGGGGVSIASDDSRREFLRAGKEWFGSYEATLEHFRGIEQTTIPGQPYLHRAAKERLEAVMATLSGPGPSSTVAFSFRKAFTADTHYTPASMHTLGYAIDYDAYNMPRIGNNDTAELLRLVGNKGVSHAELGEYSARRDLIRKTGDATAAGEAAPAGSAELLDQIRSESPRLSDSSQAFQASLGSAKDDFLELRTQYFEATDKDAKAAVLAKVPALLKPWFDAIVAEEQRITAAATAAGLDPAALPTKAVLTARVAAIGKAKTDAAAALKTAKGVEPKPAAAVWKKLPGWEKTTGTDGQGTFAERIQKIMDAAPLFAAALEPVVGGKEILARLTSLRTKLAQPAYLFGTAKKKKGDRPTTTSVVSDPSAAQLLERGYFNPKDPVARREQFNAEFMVALAQHGFDLGMAWGGESTDSMHMELVVPKGS